MALTPAQLPVLRAAILAETDPAFVAARQANDETTMAAFYYAASTFVVWLGSVTRDAVTVEGFDWTQVDNLTTGQARIWDLLFDNQSRTINAADAGKRAGIAEAWKGTAGKVAVATFVLSKCKRFALQGEKVFATGTGTDASPGVMTFQGSISTQDISDALRA